MRLFLVLALACLLQRILPAHLLAQTSPEAPPLHPEIALQVGHSSSVLSVAFSPDGKFLASGSADHTVKLWDLQTGTLLKTMNASQPQPCVAFSPDGTTLAARADWAYGYTVDLRTGEHTASLAIHGALATLAFSPDGSAVVGGSHAGCVRLWGWRTNTWRDLLASGPPVNSVAFSPDGHLLAIGTDAGRVRLLDMRTAAFHPVEIVQGSPVRSVAFSTDGKALASAGGGKWAEVKLWDPNTGSLRRTLRVGKGEVRSVAFSPDGRTLANGSSRPDGPDAAIERCTVGQVSLWDYESGTLKATLAARTGGIRAAAFSPDGCLAAAGGDDASVRVWDVRTGALRYCLAGCGGSIQSLSVSPDGRTAAAGCEDGRVRIWHPQASELARVLLAHPGPVRAVRFSPDGRVLATAGEDHAVRIWDAHTGALRRVLGGHPGHVWSLAFSPDGEALATGSYREMRLWDAGTGRLRRVLKGHPDFVSSLAFSPDGSTLFSGSRSRRGEERTDEELYVWDVATGQRKSQLHPLGYWVRSLAFSPDGHTLGIGAEGAQLWGTSSWQRRAELAGSRGEALAFSPDGRIVATAAGEYGLASGIRLWQASTGTLLRTLSGHTQPTRSLAFLPEGTKLLSGSDDATVRLWDVPSGRLLATFVAAPDTPPPGTFDARAGTAGGKPISADSKALDAVLLGTQAPENYLVITPEGYYMGPAGADRYVRFRLGDGFFPVECFQDRFYRPHLVKRALEGHDLPPVGAFRGPYPPLVRFIEPGAAAQGDSVTVTVQATDDSGIQRVEFAVDGSYVDARPIAADSKPIAADSKLVAGDGRASLLSAYPSTHRVPRELAATIPLPPDGQSFQLQAIAYDDDGLRSPRARIMVTRRGRAPTKGRLLGLCVGVSRHVDPRLNLKYADADALALTQAFSRQRGLYERAEVRALTSEQATRPAIQASLDALVSSATHADTVVILLSGHGWRSSEGQFYFAPHEVDPRDVAGTALPWAEVVRTLRSLSSRSRQVIVLLDACHSGSAGGATNDDLVQAAVRANAGVRILASSRGSERSRELDGFRHGAFTQALLEGLQGKAALHRRTITLASLIVYVADRVRVLSQDQQHPHIPLLQDFDPSMPIASKP